MRSKGAGQSLESPLRGPDNLLLTPHPEEAGGGGPIPSLATMFSVTYRLPPSGARSILFQFHTPGLSEFAFQKGGTESGEAIPLPVFIFSGAPAHFHAATSSGSGRGGVFAIRPRLQDPGRHLCRFAPFAAPR